MNGSLKICVPAVDSSKKYYPIFLSLAGKKILVVGGGAVALRKVRSLLKCSAQITVVTKEAHPRLLSLANENRITLRRGGFRVSDLEKKDLVFCATNDHPFNSRVAQTCAQKGIWVNVVDEPALCSFIVPSLVHRGEVTFAVSTGGASPALAKFLRKKIEVIFGREIGEISKQLKNKRKFLLKLSLKKRRKVLKNVFGNLGKGGELWKF